MRKLLAVLTIVLVLFGCTGQAQGGAKGGATVTASGSGGSEGTEAGQPRPAPSPAPGAAATLTGLGFAQLTALGVPVECNVRMTDKKSGQTQNVKMYLKGQDVRVESATDEPTCPKSVTIIQSSKSMAYVGCPGGQGVTPQCKWLKFPINASGTGAGSEMAVESTSTNDLEGLPSTDFDCKAGLFGDEMFLVNEPSCSMEDLIRQAGVGASGSVNASAYGG